MGILKHDLLPFSLIMLRCDAHFLRCYETSGVLHVIYYGTDTEVIVYEYFLANSLL